MSNRQVQKLVAIVLLVIAAILNHRRSWHVDHALNDGRNDGWNDGRWNDELNGRLRVVHDWAVASGGCAGSDSGVVAPQSRLNQRRN